MTKPTPKIRQATYARDNNRCVSCGTTEGIQYQHRAAEGMGGRKAPPTIDEGVTSCAICNPGYEGPEQIRALRTGWKVRRWVVEQSIAYRVPVFYLKENQWHLLNHDGSRPPISRARARGLMEEIYGQEYHDWLSARLP